MYGEGYTRNTLVPLVLRVALGIIFVYHGLQKVTDHNAWGAAWAANFYHQQYRMPDDVRAKLDAVAADVRERQTRSEEKDKNKGKEKGKEEGKDRDKENGKEQEKGKEKAKDRDRDREKAREGAEKKGEWTRLTPTQVTTVRDRLAERYSREGEKGVPEALRWYAVQLAVAWAELIGGLALLLGLLTRVAAAGMILIQLGAIYLVTYQKSFSFSAGGGYEYNVALIAMCLALVLGGAGLLSMDALTHIRSARHPHHATAGPTEPVTAART